MYVTVPFILVIRSNSISLKHSRKKNLNKISTIALKTKLI